MKQITFYLLSLFVSVLLLVGCSNEPPTPEELYKEEASGVVMVLNKFYYNVTLPSGDHLYFTSIGEMVRSLDLLTISTRYAKTVAT